MLSVEARVAVHLVLVWMQPGKHYSTLHGLYTALQVMIVVVDAPDSPHVSMASAL